MVSHHPARACFKVLPMKVITANLNGIRSAASKGFFEWLELQGADVVGVQEIKAQTDQVEGILCKAGHLQGHFHYAT